MLTDFERPLTERGRNDARNLGDFFKRKNIAPDAYMSSPANRALTTARMVGVGMGFPLENILVKEKIYEATLDDLLYLLRGLDDKLNTVMIFGHNPGFLMLAEWLSGRSIEEFPTCTVFGVELTQDSWKEVKQGANPCILFQSPKRNLL